MRFQPFILLAGIASLLVACSAESSDVDDEADVEESSEAVSAAPTFTPGTLRLYPRPGGNTRPSCDVHTRLDLVRDAGFPRARLREMIVGSCGLTLPNDRTYDLRLARTECGSRYWTGSFQRFEGPHTITIADHRARTCGGAPPAPVVVQERTATGTTTKYAAR